MQKFTAIVSVESSYQTLNVLSQTHNMMFYTSLNMQ